MRQKKYLTYLFLILFIIGLTQQAAIKICEKAQCHFSCQTCVDDTSYGCVTCPEGRSIMPSKSLQKITTAQRVDEDGELYNMNPDDYQNFDTAYVGRCACSASSQIWQEYMVGGKGVEPDNIQVDNGEQGCEDADSLKLLISGGSEICGYVLIFIAIVEGVIKKTFNPLIIVLSCLQQFGQLYWVKQNNYGLQLDTFQGLYNFNFGFAMSGGRDQSEGGFQYSFNNFPGELSKNLQAFMLFRDNFSFLGRTLGIIIIQLLIFVGIVVVNIYLRKVMANKSQQIQHEQILQNDPKFTTEANQQILTTENAAFQPTAQPGTQGATMKSPKEEHLTVVQTITSPHSQSQGQPIDTSHSNQESRRELQQKQLEKKLNDFSQEKKEKTMNEKLQEMKKEDWLNLIKIVLINSFLFVTLITAQEICGYLALGIQFSKSVGFSGLWFVIQIMALLLMFTRFNIAKGDGGFGKIGYEKLGPLRRNFAFYFYIIKIVSGGIVVATYGKDTQATIAFVMNFLILLSIGITRPFKDNEPYYNLRLFFAHSGPTIVSLMLMIQDSQDINDFSQKDFYSFLITTITAVFLVVLIIAFVLLSTSSVLLEGVRKDEKDKIYLRRKDLAKLKENIKQQQQRQKRGNLSMQEQVFQVSCIPIDQESNATDLQSNSEYSENQSEKQDNVEELSGEADDQQIQAKDLEYNNNKISQDNTIQEQQSKLESSNDMGQSKQDDKDTSLFYMQQSQNNSIANFQPHQFSRQSIELESPMKRGSMTSLASPSKKKKEDRYSFYLKKFKSYYDRDKEIEMKFKENTATPGGGPSPLKRASTRKQSQLFQVTTNGSQKEINDFVLF